MTSFNEDFDDFGTSANLNSSLADIGLAKLESKLAVQQHCSGINLSDCFIGDQGCSLLADFLRQNSYITSLELRGNSISGEGAQVLAGAFKMLINIRAISLEWNNIGDHVSTILDSLSLSRTLQSIDLRNNRITAEGASGISRFIETNTSVSKIDLRWNEIGPQGGKKILQVLNRNSSLQTLELTGNKIPEEILVSIDSELSKSPQDYKPAANFSESHQDPPIQLQDLQASERKKEKSSYTNELYSKYETLVITNARNEAKINELEIILQQEQRKLQDLRNDLYKELEAEKTRRVYAEESLIVFKEESLNRDFANQQLIHELESRVSSLSNEKNSVILQFQTLQQAHESSLNEFRSKSQSYEDRILAQEQSFRSTEENFRSLLERTKREHQHHVQDISQDFQIKLESLTGLNSSLVSSKESLENEIKSLRNQINSIKTSSEQSLRDLEFELKEEEKNKLSSNSRNYEAKIANVEEMRDSLARRIQEMQKDFNLAEKKLEEQVRVLECSLTQAREEKNDLTMRLQKVSALKDNLQNDLFVNKSALDRSQAENAEITKAFRERKETHAAQVEKICFEHAEERKKLEGMRDGLAERLKECEGELAKVKREKDKNIRDLDYLNEMLKSKVGLMIQETVMGHMRKVAE